MDQQQLLEADRLLELDPLDVRAPLEDRGPWVFEGYQVPGSREAIPTLARALRLLAG